MSSLTPIQDRPIAKNSKFTNIKTDFLLIILEKGVIMLLKKNKNGKSVFI